MAGVLVSAPWSVYLLNTGLFAVSGGITNWLAVHMLFERVPGFYGSGVIPLRFEEFKLGIRRLIMEQFFNHSGLEEFFHGSGETSERLSARLREAVDQLDLEAAFDSLLEVILSSPLGGMLGMLGGRDALNPLRNPFVLKMREFFQQQLMDSGFQEQIKDALSSALDDQTIRRKLEEMIDHRLAQMTPEMVKEIVQQMIRKHLGWLVVWGCVLGGLIGLTVAIVTGL